MMMRVKPIELEELISSMPAIRPSWRSSGVATVAAMVSGLAPGSRAITTMVGKSTFGIGATGIRKKPTIPERVMARVSSVVVTGR